VVLTFVQPGSAAGRWKTYLRAGKAWDIFSKRLRRFFGRFAYIQTWERHKLGGCHVHAAIGNKTFASWAEADYAGLHELLQRRFAVPAGFGPVLWVERLLRAGPEFAGYITKLASELTGSGPKNQVPFDAPPHFRRIRASRGILPKKPESEMTGELVRCPLPEYDYSRSRAANVCGSAGRPAATTGGKIHATDKGDLAEASRLACSGHN
jgi:hypothetical protein